MTRKEAGKDDVADQLEELRLSRERQRAEEKLQKELKEDLVEIVEEMGEFWYIDSEGNKRYAYYSDSELKDVDIEELEAAVEAGLLDPSVIDEVAPRKVDITALDNAVRAGRIPRPVAKKAVRLVHGRKTIRYSDPIGG